MMRSYFRMPMQIRLVTRVTVASVDSERRIYLIFRNELKHWSMILLTCAVIRDRIHHHAEIFDGLQWFHVNITDMERTVVYLMNESQGSAPQELCL